MDRFVDVATVDRIAPGTSLVVRIARETAALFNVGGRLYAIEDACPRCSASLGAGTVFGDRVRCGCGWEYDLATGRVNGIPALAIDTFHVKVVGSHVMVSSCAAWVPRAR